MLTYFVIRHNMHHMLFRAKLVANVYSVHACVLTRNHDITTATNHTTHTHDRLLLM
jgi:hypothetical protein